MPLPSGNLPNHSYAIPYHFTQAEKDAWLSSQWDNIPLQGYLASPALTPAGLMFQDGYAQIIVWEDARGVVHVIDASNMAVTQHVNDAAYSSPDSSAVMNAINEITTLFDKLPTLPDLAEAVPLFILGYLGVLIWSKK